MVAIGKYTHAYVCLPGCPSPTDSEVKRKVFDISEAGMKINENETLEYEQYSKTVVLPTTKKHDRSK